MTLFDPEGPAEAFAPIFVGKTRTVLFCGEAAYLVFKLAPCARKRTESASG